MSELRNVSSNPHVRSRSTTQSIMLLVFIALLPAAGFGIYNFGLRAALILGVAVVSSVLFELLMDKLLKKKVTISDFSAAVTGLLLGMNLPATAPVWLPVVGAFFAIVIVKMLFGGLGQNFMNPALGARCFLLISFPKFMNDFPVLDASSAATPLSMLKDAQNELGDVTQALGRINVMQMITGQTSGVIGETSMIAITVGACILIMAGVIDLRIPASYIASFFLFVLCFGPDRSALYLSAQLAGGGLMLGAFFMATDYVTSPITNTGKYIYGIFLGLMTGIFRMFGTAEGVSYAIILGNLITPLIERFTIPRAFGIRKEPKPKKIKEQEAEKA